MYQPDDTIVAISSPTSDMRTIVRLSGPHTNKLTCKIFTPTPATKKKALLRGKINIDDNLSIDGHVYLFFGPDSYTGEDVAEFHFISCPAVTDALLGTLCNNDRVRIADPGEFTARAYLNGKMDLSQAEAVNAVIASSNAYQLAASQRLLAGRLTDSIASIRSQILDTLSRIEAALDFTEQDIEFITKKEATEKLSDSISELDKLLIGSISYEEISELPAVGIAGATNAGKSSLLNRISGQSRSIVSEEKKTTRDVLSCILTLHHHKCVLFDCAGLIESPNNVLDELAQQAAIEALANSSTVIFCIDISKTDHKDDAAIFKMINPKTLIAVATKSDLVPQNELDKKLQELKDDFDIEFTATSSLKVSGIELLKQKIDRILIDLAAGTETFSESGPDALALTARHRQAVTEAIDNLTGSIDELKADQEEVAAMMLRAAWQMLAGIEQENIDEKILELIFQRFCIGK